MGSRIIAISLAALIISHAAPGLADNCDSPAEAIADADRPFVDAVDARDTLACWRDAFEHVGDRRAIFAVVYTEIVSRILAHAEEGFFEDRPWMERYVAALAEQYRRAVVAHEAEGSLAGPWGKALDASADGTLSVIQELLLGINAHYFYDLAVAIYEAGVRENLAARHRDHLALNTILAEAIDEVQERIIRTFAPGLAGLDGAFGEADEVIVAALIHGALDFAWLNARRMTVIPSFWVRFELWQFSNGIAELLLLPSYFEPVMQRLHELERPAL
jgi:hypothetical protein